jgi:hypothetical protein
MDRDKEIEGGRQNVDKTLPRGLEQVSHLFISNPHPETIPPGGPASGPHDQPAARNDGNLNIVMRRFVAREELLALLRNQAAAIEEGMRVIDANIPCDAAGTIELLAIDSKHQLAIIDLDDCPNDGLLLRGLGHFDWIARNLAIFRRMYQSYVINFSAEPRLFLVAPDFSPSLRSATRHIASPRIQCLKYQSVGLPEGTGVYFESVSGHRQ